MNTRVKINPIAQTWAKEDQSFKTQWVSFLHLHLQTLVTKCVKMNVPKALKD